MQRKDVIVVAVVALVFGYFMLVPSGMEAFVRLTAGYPYAMSFIKFAVLATLGECIALRITAGVYTREGFGVVPRFLVWGILGLFCKLTFTLFNAGTPQVLAELGLLSEDGGFGPTFVLAFSTSVFLNLFYAPVLMLSHKLADIHIISTGGTLKGLFTKPNVSGLFKRIDWDTMWGFVFKKTLPLFWIPAHTITFLLPKYFQVLFAALLSIALGVILAFAGLRAKKS